MPPLKSKFAEEPSEKHEAYGLLTPQSNVHHVYFSQLYMAISVLLALQTQYSQTHL